MRAGVTVPIAHDRRTKVWKSKTLECEFGLRFIAEDGRSKQHFFHVRDIVTPARALSFGFERTRGLYGDVADQRAGAESPGRGAAEMRALHPLIIFYGAMFLIVVLIWIAKAVPA